MPVNEIQRDFVARLDHVTGEFGHVPAIRYGGQDYTWTDIGQIVRTARSVLDRVDDNAAVAVVLRSRPWCMAAVLSTLGSGRGVLLISPVQADAALGDEIRTLAPAVLFADDEDWQRPGFAEAARGSIGVSLHGENSFAELRSDSDADTARGTMHPDAAVGIATSGTTGPAKRYSLTWEDVRFTGVRRNPTADRGAMINALPLFSIGGVSTMVSTLFGGRPVALMDRFDVMEWAETIRDYGPNRAGAPPAVLRMMLDRGVPKEWFASVKSIYTASAPLSMSLAQEFETVYQIPIVQGYGATEFAGAVTGWPGDLHERFGAAKRGSVGKPYEEVKIRIVDRETREELPPGVAGQLEVDSPRRVQGIDPGWIPTNDLARIDEDGFLWILGRSDDVIIRGGFKVHLPDVEKALVEHPDVSDACVVALTDERVGEVPGAVVVLNMNVRSSPTQADMVEWVKEKLPAYAAPTKVLILEDMPMNAMLKKDRVQVRRMLEAAVGATT